MKKIFVAFIFFVAFPAFAQTQSSVVEIQTADKKTSYLNNYSDVLATAETPICTEKNKDGKCQKSEPGIAYIYKTNDLVDTYVDEIARTKDTITFTGNRFRYYGSDQFYKGDDGEWYKIKSDVLLQSDFKAVNDTKKISPDKILNLNNPFKIYKVYAQDDYPSMPTDGSIYNYCGSGETMSYFNTYLCAAGLQTGNNDTLVYKTKNGSGYTEIDRGFHFFDLSTLPPGETITDADIYIYFTGQNNGDCSLAISGSTNNSLGASSDYLNVGSTNFLPSLAFSGITTNTYTDLNLNSSAYSYIAGGSGAILGFSFRSNWDMLIDDGAGNSTCQLSNYNSGGAYPPYLEITIGGTPPPPPPDETATPTPISCIPDNVDDISFITACSFASTTLGIVYTNYHFPFLVWVIFAVIFLFIAKFIIVEFLIRWRNAFKK